MLYPISEIAPEDTENLVGFINSDGYVVVSPRYSGGSFYFEGKASVLDAVGKSGFIDSLGNLTIPFRFEGLGHFKNGLCSINGGFIDHFGGWFIEPQFLAASQFSEGRAFASTDGNTFGFIDLRGEFLAHPEFHQCRDFSGGLAAVCRDNRWGYVDQSGEIRIPLVFEGPCAHLFRYSLAAVKIDGQWGFIDERGVFLIKPEYEDVKPFSEGHAPVRKNGKWGFINLEGTVTVDFQFDDLGELNGGMAAAKLNEKAGFISSDSSWLIRPAFDKCYQFFGMLAVVIKGKTYSYIRRDGRIVWTSKEGAKLQKPPVIL